MTSRQEAEQCRAALEALFADGESVQGTALTYDEDSDTWAVLLLIDGRARALVAAPETAVPIKIVRSGRFRPDVLGG
jgi:predicted nucleic acid-binding Zn ribbon protein